MFGRIEVDTASKEKRYTSCPQTIDPQLTDGARYLHVTTNNTIYGTQWSGPIACPVPLVADMSSDILSKAVDVNRFSLLYAGAQKNLGPAGLTVVVVRDDFLAKAREEVPTMLRYTSHVSANSLYNTPPTFAVYVMKLVLEWMDELGGVTEIQRMNRMKAGMVYGVIDEFADLYEGHAEKVARSEMNVTFRLRSDALSKQFLAACDEAGFVGVKGHRTVGGCRISLYNAVPIAAAERFSELMRTFAKHHGGGRG